MSKLENYLQDGADAQAKAVLAYVQYMYNEIVSETWNETFHSYDATPYVSVWFNGRERGYIVYLANTNYTKQINIIFFEHRNSDNICAVAWEQVSYGSPITIDTAKFGEKYSGKGDVDYVVGPGQAYEMAEWIVKTLKTFCKENYVTSTGVI